MCHAHSSSESTHCPPFGPPLTTPHTHTHTLQVVEPGVEVKPEGQALQVLEPRALVYWPDWQGSQADEPRSAAKKPVGHGKYE